MLDVCDIICAMEDIYDYDISAEDESHLLDCFDNVINYFIYDRDTDGGEYWEERKHIYTDIKRAILAELIRREDGLGI